MGRKVHPLGFRLGVIRDWQARWYADKSYADFLQEDLKLRKAIQVAYAEAAVSQVLIERQANELFVTIYTARPGIVIGRGGQRVDEMRARLEQLIGKRVKLNIQEVAQPELDAYLVARTVADQIERRIAYRRAMKQAIFRTMQAGAKGIKINCAGRLGGNEIARRENMHDGRVPLHTLRADIDYGLTEARTALGRIGVKVWIYKGDVLPESKEIEAEEVPAVEAGKGVEEVTVAAGAVQVPAPPVAVEIEVAEVPAPPVAIETVEAAPVAAAEAEKKPARARKAKAEAAPAAEAEKKPARARKAKAEVAPAAEAEKKPARARKTRVKAAPSAAVAESTIKSTADKVTEVESATTEGKEEDVTTQAGEIPQAS